MRLIRSVNNAYTTYMSDVQRTRKTNRSSAHQRVSLDLTKRTGKSSPSKALLVEKFRGFQSYC